MSSANSSSNEFPIEMIANSVHCSIFLSDKPLSFIVRLKSATDNVCISTIASNFTRTNIAPVYAKKKHKDKVLHFFENKLNLCLNMAHQPV